MADPIVRRARKEDLRELEALYSSPDLKTTKREARWFIRCYFDYHHVVVAKIEGKIRGACFWRVEGEECCGLAWVENVWVEEAHRRRGVGEILLRRTVKDMRDYYAKRGTRLRRVMLTTQSERTSARGLYQRLGFGLKARLGDLYGPRSEDLAYVLELGP
jgi:ribosomal protein S18 acetylase RimI-like enzyme